MSELSKSENAELSRLGWSPGMLEELEPVTIRGIINRKLSPVYVVTLLPKYENVGFNMYLGHIETPPEKHVEDIINRYLNKMIPDEPKTFSVTPTKTGKAGFDLIAKMQLLYTIQPDHPIRKHLWEQEYPMLALAKAQEEATNEP